MNSNNDSQFQPSLESLDSLNMFPKVERQSPSVKPQTPSSKQKQLLSLLQQGQTSYFTRLQGQQGKQISRNSSYGSLITPTIQKAKQSKNTSSHKRGNLSIGSVEFQLMQNGEKQEQFNLTKFELFEGDRIGNPPTINDMIVQVRKLTIENETLRVENRILTKTNEQLTKENRISAKEIEKLTRMLEFQQISSKQKDLFFSKMVQQNIEIKTKLDDVTLKSHPIRNSEITKDSKESQPQIRLLSPPKTHKPISAFQDNTLTTISSNSEVQQRQKPMQSDHESAANEIKGTIRSSTKRWTQIKQVFEDRRNVSSEDTSASVVIATSPIKQSKKTQHPIIFPSSQTNIPLIAPTSNFSTFSSQQTLNVSSKNIKLFKQSNSRTPSHASEAKSKQNLRPMFIQHSTDNAFYSSALDLAMSENEVREFFLEGKYIKFVKGHFSDEANLRKLIYNLEGQTLKYFYDSVNSLLGFLSVGMNLILKTKQVIKCIFNLQHKMNISEVFDALTNECTKIFFCAKAQIFLLDEKSKLFWTKGNKTSEMIKLSIEQAGICSHVVKSGQLINILDAQLDDRFDKGTDEKNNFKTKSLLCVPILDSKSHSSRVMGVLQIVNKNDQSFFTKDDEGVLKVIALLSENLLRNSVFNDERAEFYNSLRFLYRYSIDAINSESICELIEVSYQFLSRSLNIPQSKIVLYDFNERKLFSYQGKEKVIFPANDGVAGKVFGSRFMRVNSNISEDTDFNRIIDIETQLPVVTLPIFSINKQKNDEMQQQEVENNTDSNFTDTICCGTLQIINSRGIHSLILQSEKDSQVLFTNYDTLERFNRVFSAAVAKFMSVTPLKVQQ